MGRHGGERGAEGAGLDVGASGLGWGVMCVMHHHGIGPQSRQSLEKGMATHSSILAWRIPGTE